MWGFITCGARSPERELFTCVVGDIWGTGKQDLVTGNFTMQEGADAVVIWKNVGPTTGPRPPP